MNFYQAVRNTWKKPKEGLGGLWRERLIEWRRDPAIKRIDKPTRIDRARGLGYKAKQGYVIARVKLLRGGRQRSPPLRKGRRSKRATVRKIVGKSYQWVAEERAAKRFRNCEVLNSYYVAHDGRYYWYEIILVDKEHPVIKNDKKINWICRPTNRGRVFRGLTSAGKKSRGLGGKGEGYEKTRPSLRAHRDRGKS